MGKYSRDIPCDRDLEAVLLSIVDLFVSSKPPSQRGMRLLETQERIRKDISDLFDSWEKEE